VRERENGNPHQRGLRAWSLMEKERTERSEGSGRTNKAECVNYVKKYQ